MANATLEDRLSSYQVESHHRRRSAPRKAVAGFAGAAAAFAAAGHANAAIHYSGPINQTISVNPVSTTSFESFSVDLNGDAVIDFTMSVLGSSYSTDGSTYSNFRADIRGDNGNIHATSIGFSGYVNPLPAGSPISSGLNFENFPTFVSTSSGDVRGSFTGVAFAGVSFEIGGNTHFGWMRFDVQADGNGDGSLTLIDYAWEDVPDTAITTGEIPEPSTLGLLALGAAGVLAGRRRRTQA